MTDDEYMGQHLYHRFLGRNPDGRELQDLVEHGLGYGGYFWPDPRLRSQADDVPLLVLFTSCHAEQILTYLKEYRPDVLESHSIFIAFTHRLLLWRGHFHLNLLHAIFARADKLLCNLMTKKFDELSTAALLPYTKPSCQVVTFVPPSFSAFFPVSKFYGEEPVAKGLVEGKSVGQMIEEFHAGTFNCMFDYRYAVQIERLKAREADHDIGLTEFVEKHHKTTKLWFCDNHPTFNIIAHVTNLALERFGFKKHDDPEHALKVPVNGGNFSNHFPETDYERAHYKFQYPKRFVDDWGGPGAFYPSVIVDVAARMRDPQAVLDKPFVPVELEQ